MKSWTEAHQREALRRIYELAAELAAEQLEETAGDVRAAAEMVRGLRVWMRGEP